VTLPCKRQMSAPVFMTRCSRERGSWHPSRKPAMSRPADYAHAHDDRTNLYSEITDKITVALKAGRVRIEPHMLLGTVRCASVSASGLTGHGFAVTDKRTRRQVFCRPVRRERGAQRPVGEARIAERFAPSDALLSQRELSRSHPAQVRSLR
jgi:hypothetical protein